MTLKQLLPPNLVKEAVPAFGGGAAVAAANRFLNDMLPASFKDAAYKKLLVALAEGFIVGRVLWNTNRDLAKGALGGAGALAGQELLAMVLDARPAAGAGALYGMDESTVIEDQTRVNGTTLADSVEVEEESASALTGWM